MAEIKYIPVSKLWGHPDNPRKDLGDVTELAESIKVNGVLQNLTVVPLFGEITKKWDGESYRVIIGHRRLAAAKLTGQLCGRSGGASLRRGRDVGAGAAEYDAHGEYAAVRSDGLRAGTGLPDDA